MATIEMIGYASTNAISKRTYMRLQAVWSGAWDSHNNNLFHPFPVYYGEETVLEHFSHHYRLPTYWILFPLSQRSTGLTAVISSNSQTNERSLSSEQEQMTKGSTKQRMKGLVVLGQCVWRCCVFSIPYAFYNTYSLFVGCQNVVRKHTGGVERRRWSNPEPHPAGILIRRPPFVVVLSSVLGYVNKPKLKPPKG